MDLIGHKENILDKGTPHWIKVHHMLNTLDERIDRGRPYAEFSWMKVDNTA